jgi:hypothetical protein
MKPNAWNGWGGSTLTKPGYLERLEKRKGEQRLQAQAVFGVIGGGLLFSIAGFKYFYLGGGIEQLWAFLCLTGGVLILTGFFYPPALAPVLKVYLRLGNSIGSLILSILLILIYFLVITPGGAIVKKLRGTTPFYRWDTTPPEPIEGWSAKIIQVEEKPASRTSKKRYLLAQPILIITYFIRYKNFVFIPVLLLLITIGLLMFFITTSTLAPLIYTLF